MRICEISPYAIQDKIGGESSRRRIYHKQAKRSATQFIICASYSSTLPMSFLRIKTSAIRWLGDEATTLRDRGRTHRCSRKRRLDRESVNARGTPRKAQKCVMRGRRTLIRGIQVQVPQCMRAGHICRRGSEQAQQEFCGLELSSWRSRDERAPGTREWQEGGKCR
jgi:hypothetical protein